MPIKKESILAMASALKIDAKIINDAIAAEAETEIKITEGLTILTATELEGRENVLKTAGQKAGKEFAVKEMKEAAGLEYEGEGSKDPKRFVTEHSKKVLKDSNVVESEKIKEKDTIIEGLRTNITTLTSEKDTLVKGTKEAQQDQDLLTMTIDRKPENLTNKEWLTIIKLNNEIAEHEGGLVVKRDGKIVSTPTDLKPIPVKDALNSWIDERKIGKVVADGNNTKGRGEGDSKVNISGIGNMKQFNDHLTEKGINANGAQAQAMLTEITTANPNFDFSNKAT